MRQLFNFLFFSVFCFAFSFEELKHEPAGYAKDLFLLNAMEQNISKKEAYEAYFLTKSPKSEHSSLLLKKSGSKNLSVLFDCMDSNITKALKKTPECAELGVNYKKISQALINGSQEVAALSENIKEIAPDKSKKIELLQQVATGKQPLTNDTLSIYFESSKEFRQAFFDLNLTDKELGAITASNNAKRFVKWILFDENSSDLGKSVSRLECNTIDDGETLFFLGLLKIKNGENALECLIKSAKKSKNESDRDRAYFWSYLYGGNKEFLDTAAKSTNTNFYSLVAKEREDIEPKNIEFISTKAENPQLTNDINITNPFYWQHFKAEVKTANGYELDRILKTMAETKDADAYYLYAKEKKEGYKKERFLMPYKDYFNDFNDSQKTLLHAIGRQESFFIPGDVSSAYAIGVMQIIPVLAEELARKKHEKLSFFDLFEPKKNISYAATHFRWLESKVWHPTLIAVSYNAGYGFFRRIQKNGLFVFEDNATMPYEPFWSIENIPYDETRNYAKRVSLNYAIYSEKFGQKITLNQLLENLIALRRKD